MSLELYDEAFRLLARAQELLLCARKEHAKRAGLANCEIQYGPYCDSYPQCYCGMKERGLPVNESASLSEGK